MRRGNVRTLPISGRMVPATTAWQEEQGFLFEAGIKSAKTESTYRSGLRLFADWLQHYGRAGYTLTDSWPLSPITLTTADILNFRNWLLAHRARATATTYTSAVIGYLLYLDGQDHLPLGVQLGKLQQQIARRQVERNPAEAVIDQDQARQNIPQIILYYDGLPLPVDNDRYNRRLSLLRDRALVHTLYATAARISEVVRLNRAHVGNGRASHATITGKGSKPRTIHIRPYAQHALQAYLNERTDNNPALFIAHSRNAQSARLSSTAAHNIIKKAVNALGLDPNLSAHDFRHFRATQLLREGMPLEVVQEYLGHADIATTRNIYAPVLGVHIVSDWLDQVDKAPGV
ncbi:MAG: tyrosine-type recombinase/integrase [Anaerolineae bacterium]|nr:tyrosine-type recombinase/integrase [Anaerolineae bacterium]